MGDGSVDATRIAELVQLTDGWLDQDLAGSTGEWAYSQCERCLFVEEKVGTGDATAPPVNFKASVFDGEVHRWGMVQWNGTEWCISYFSPEWQPLGVSNSGFPNCHEVRRPRVLQQMNASADAIAGGLDFLRVDLYEVDGEIWFGETSAYPNSGLLPFSPPGIDLEWGRLWKLPEH
jgi:hypothetical protein